MPTQVGDSKHLCAPTSCEPRSHGNRHEWVCGSTTSERSDWRRRAYPEMAVFEGESKATRTNKQPGNQLIGVRFQFQSPIYLAFMMAEPAPLAGTPPSASRCAPMLSGRRTRHRCCEQEIRSQRENSTPLVNHRNLCSPTTSKPTSRRNRHEWVCGPTTSERSDWRRPAYPEMAV